MAKPRLAFEPPPGTGLPVLTANGGRVRGELVLRNEHRVPVAVPPLEIRAPSELAAPVVEAWHPEVLAPGEAGRVNVSASIDRLTPPGTHEVELELDGVVQPALLRVVEDVALTLSERELVVAGDVGVKQTRSLVLTNRGNVPLEVRRIGPVELEDDLPRPSLLERLGVIAPEPQRTSGTLLQRMGVVAPDPTPAEQRHERHEHRRDDDDEARPTLAAHLHHPVTILPGEVATTDWIVTVEGPVRPGARYRATAPLYTSDITFVVTPSQAAPPPRPRRTPRRAAGAGTVRPRAAGPPSQKGSDA